MFGILLFIAISAATLAVNVNRFPDDFQFGCATSAYQIEGGWNADGKGENIWDHTLHINPKFTVDRNNGDVACDSYHLYKDDVAKLKEMGVNFYRISLSWSRILPNGFANKLNQAGIDYYNNLINELLANNIVPMVTMYHWDLPQPLQNLGGWPNPILADYFVDFARVAFEQFGDRVKWWITFNEPVHVCRGYTDHVSFAPGIRQPGVGDYLCGHTVLLAHGRTFRMYDKEFREKQQGKITITLDGFWAEPANLTDEDELAADRAMQFHFGWFAHPVYSKRGDYPEVMRQRVDNNSYAEGFPKSRLPTFTTEEIEYIRGSFDYFGLNHYTSVMVRNGTMDKPPSRAYDAGIVYFYDPSWPDSASIWLKVVPWGFRKLLNWVKNSYDDPLIIITENGFSDRGGLHDTGRIQYHKSYLLELLKAIHLDGVNVKGYAVWSLLDNLEWANGFTEKFGLYYVNFTDPSRPRIPKESSRFLAKIISSREVLN